MGGGGGAQAAAAQAAAAQAAAAQAAAAHAAAEEAAAWEYFREDVQDYWGNFFEYHRRGLTQGTANPWDDPDIPPLYVRPPRGASWDGTHPGDLQAIFDVQARTRWGYQRFNSGGGAARQQKRAGADAAAQGIRDSLAAQGMAIRLVKVLGFGGNGIASLFEVWPAGDAGPSKKVVVKSLLRAGQSMNDEASVTAALRRARHIVQLLNWGREIMQTPGSNADAVAAQWAPVDNDPAMMTLEFMRHGDLHGLIKKLARNGDTVPNKVLWRVFFCLVRGCIAMYAPPRLTRGPNGMALPWDQWRSVYGPDLDEVMPAQTIQVPFPDGWDLVHFDLDPQNVLIGENDNNEHSMAPIFKISDLGLAKTTDDPRFSSPTQSWDWRRMGKITILLPEQHHKEWDYIDRFPAAEPTRPRVAGQYGPWSNIYQAATCMQNLITKTTTPYPPAAFGPINGPDGHPAAVVRDSAGNVVPPFYTHGITLTFEADLDQQLMHLLLRCLADLPRDRPSLYELEFLMRSMEGAADWAIGPDDPDGVRAWCTRIFSEPPPPPMSAREIYAALAPDASAAARIEVPRTDRIPPRADGGGNAPDPDGPGDGSPYDGAGTTLVPETAPMISGTVPRP
ncbi:hypothetical protein diail_3298 [Diaporthe ilicicola]|nr:hypothetical protein diail_3298 [Diaporthe ilicicola]